MTNQDGRHWTYESAYTSYHGRFILEQSRGMLKPGTGFTEWLIFQLEQANSKLSDMKTALEKNTPFLDMTVFGEPIVPDEEVKQYLSSVEAGDVLDIQEESETEEVTLPGFLYREYSKTGKVTLTIVYRENTFTENQPPQA